MLTSSVEVRERKVNRKRITCWIGLMVMVCCIGCSERQTEKSSAIQFDCAEFLYKFNEHSHPETEFREEMHRVINQNSALVAYQWVCLKNGSVKKKNADYLKVVEAGKYGRRRPHLKNLNRWASCLFSDLSKRKRADQIAILKRLSNNLKNTIASEDKVFADGLRAFEKNQLSLENLIIGFSLSDINSSDLESNFRIQGDAGL